MWIVCITSVRHVLTVNGYGGRQTKENEKSWCFKGWETLVNNCTLALIIISNQAFWYDPAKYFHHNLRQDILQPLNINQGIITILFQLPHASKMKKH